jgi:hypothetical protein
MDRVTGGICEKIAQNLAQSVFSQSKT